MSDRTYLFALASRKYPRIKANSSDEGSGGIIRRPDSISWLASCHYRTELVIWVRVCNCAIVEVVADPKRASEIAFRKSELAQRVSLRDSGVGNPNPPSSFGTEAGKPIFDSIRRSPG
jgi:hypothetical protein